MTTRKWGLTAVLIAVLVLSMMGGFSSGTTPISAEGSDPDWAIMNSNTTSNLRDVWGNSSTDVFAVGENGTILHYNGSAWSVMTSNTNDDLWGVWGSNASDVFAVGDGGTILNFNGSEWVQMNSNSNECLGGVWGTSGEDVFAVGNALTILNYDGSAWTKMHEDQNGGILWGIDGTSSSDVFTGGCWNAFMYYDGSIWSDITIDDTICIADIWVNNSTDVFGVGPSGGFGYWDGSDINYISTETSETLWDVWGTDHDDVYIVGEAGIIEHYDGSACIAMDSGAIQDDLYGIWGNGLGDMFVVGDNGTILRKIKPWAYVLYMAGDNDFEDDMTYSVLGTIGGYFGDDGNYSDGNINVVAQLDRYDGDNTEFGNWTTCRRYYVAPGTIPDNGSEIEDIGEVDMGDPDTLVNFVQWAAANYPAHHYILDLEDHGAVFMMCFDFTNNSALYTNKLQEALETISSNISIDVIYFSMCLMSTIEVAYEIRNYSDVMLGWETQGLFLHPGMLIQEIKSNPDVSAVDLGTLLAQDVSFTQGDDVWTATETAHINDLGNATDLLAQTMKDNWSTDPAAVKDAAQTVMAAINNSVIAMVNPSAGGAHGLSIFFPKTLTDFNECETVLGQYDDTFDFANDTAWRDFLLKYYSNMSGSWIEDARAASLSWGGTVLGTNISLDPMTDLYKFCENIVNASVMMMNFSCTSSSGYGVRYNLSNYYDQVWNATIAGNTSCGGEIFVNQNSYPSGGGLLRRGWVFFNTSEIPDNASVKGAYLMLYKHSNVSQDQATDLIIQSGINGYPMSGCPTSNWNRSNYSDICGQFDVYNVTYPAWCNISLNDLGKSWVNKTGITSFGLRDYNDVYNISPGANTRKNFRGYSNETYKPYLKVELELPTPSPTPTVSPTATMTP